MRNIPLHIVLFCQVVTLAFWTTFLMQMDPINLASEQPLFSGGDTPGGPNNPNSSWQTGPAPTACPWLTAAERDNQGFKTLTVNVPGSIDSHLQGAVVIPCQWSGESPLPSFDPNYYQDSVFLQPGYWLLAVLRNTPAFAAYYSKPFGGGPGGAYTLQTVFSGSPPAGVIVTIP